MQNYPILKTTSGVYPELLMTNASDLVLQLIAKPIYIFSVYQMDSADRITKRYKYLLNAINKNFEDFEFEFDNKDKFILGYNQRYGFMMLSDPEKKNTGMIEIIDDKLIYNENGIPPKEQRDSYMFTAPLEYFIPRSFEDVVEEFLEKNYKLFSSTHSEYRPRDKFTIDAFTDLKEISIEQLR